MRKKPGGVPAAVARKNATMNAPIERRYRFVTYVMGGGVALDPTNKHIKVADSRTLIRAASIRGHLRFWWRACNPRRCTTISELQAAEENVWGSTKKASPVTVEVIEQPSPPANLDIYEYKKNQAGKTGLRPRDGMQALTYGAFPLRPNEELQRQQVSPGQLQDYGASTFTIRIYCSASLRSDVEVALQAWESFGGLGARTRRGFGAILRVDPAPAPLSSVQEWLNAQRDVPRIDGLPSLSYALFDTSTRTYPDGLEAWKKALGALQRFRQGKGVGRNHAAAGSHSPAGRSRWPEADAIRALTGQAAPLHRRPIVDVEAYPRASFGMPIVFHFKQGPKDSESYGDPAKDLELRPVDADRLASPLIVRPILDGQRFRAMALILDAPIPDTELVAGDRRWSVTTQLDQAMARKIPVLTVENQSFVDPLRRFLKELAKC